MAYNEARPQLMGLYMTLGVEATDPDHPAHDYFIRRPDQVWEFYSTFTWRLPPQVVEADGWPTMHKSFIELLYVLYLAYAHRRAHVGRLHKIR